MNRSQNLIKKLFEEDQKDRRALHRTSYSDKKLWDEVKKRDKKRAFLVKKILANKPKLRAVDYLRASIIFQHGTTINSVKFARKLAGKSAALGSREGKWLIAAATDRILLMQGKKQKFGTQYRKNKKGRWELYPVRAITTDKERAKYNVVPLVEAKKRADRLNKKFVKFIKNQKGITQRK